MNPQWYISRLRAVLYRRRPATSTRRHQGGPFGSRLLVSIVLTMLTSREQVQLLGQREVDRFTNGEYRLVAGSYRWIAAD
jgi:hypothetical protein